jgi:hypothetical protein
MGAAVERGLPGDVVISRVTGAVSVPASVHARVLRPDDLEYR